MTLARPVAHHRGTLGHTGIRSAHSCAPAWISHCRAVRGPRSRPGFDPSFPAARTPHTRPARTPHSRPSWILTAG